MGVTIEQIRDALAHNNKAALELISLRAIADATASMVDTSMDVWTEGHGFRTEMEQLLGIDIIRFVD